MNAIWGGGDRKWGMKGIARSAPRPLPGTSITAKWEGGEHNAQGKTVLWQDNPAITPKPASIQGLSGRKVRRLATESVVLSPTTVNRSTVGEGCWGAPAGIPIEE